MTSGRATPYLFLAPFLLLFVVFSLFPLVFSLVLAFHGWEPAAGWSSWRFLGLENFSFALDDPWFWKSLKNTAWLAVASGVPQHVIALPLAALLHQAVPWLRNGVVGAYFLPYITSTVAVAMVFSMLFSTDYGVVNVSLAQLAKSAGLGWLLPAEPVAWLSDPDMIKPSVALLVFWRYVGFNVALYLAAMQTIPKDLYEAATVDGANAWQQFWWITVPSLKPMIFFGVTLTMIGGLQLFEEPFVMTDGRGGSDQAAMTTAIYLYRTAFEFDDFGTASAMSWLLFIVIAVLTWLTNRAFRTRQEAA